MLEFDSISVSSYEAASLASQLTEKSTAGWQVVSIVSAGSSVTAYLSREAQASSEAAPDSESDTDTDTSAGDVSASGGADAHAGIVADDPVETPAVDPTPSYGGSVEVPAIDEPAVDTPLLPSEPSTSWEPVSEAPQATPEQPSLADDLAALASQIEDDHTDPAPVDEPSGWAVSGTETGTPMNTYEPMVPETAPATEQQPAQEPAAQPAQEPAAAANAAPAGWYADPSTRFELRYWDGAQWTEHVSRAGQQYTDPPVA